MISAKKIIVFLSLTFCIFSHAQKRIENFSYNPKRDKRVLSQIPISILEIPTLNSKEWLISYRYWENAKKDMLFEDTNISNSEVLKKYPFTLDRMQQNVHMLQAIYTPIIGFSILAIVPYISNSAYFETINNNEMRISYNGFGDSYIAALFLLTKGRKHSLYFNGGLYIPTGNIEMERTVFSVENITFPYSMQLGTGSWKPILGATFLRDFTIGSVGAKISYILEGNENRKSHKVGSLLQGNLWAGFNVLKNWGVSAHLQYKDRASLISETNDIIYNNSTTLFNSTNTGRNLLDIGLNVYYKPIYGIFKDQVFAVEYLLPLNQKVNGTQLRNASTFVFGLKYTLKPKINLKKGIIGF